MRAAASALDDGDGDGKEYGGDTGDDARRARFLDDALDAVVVQVAVVVREFLRVLDIYSVGRFCLADVSVWKKMLWHLLFITT